MFRQVHNALHITRLRLTPSELILLSVACGLVFASFTPLAETSLHTGTMVLAAAALVALVHERSNTRQLVRSLGERLNTAAALDKHEVGGVAEITPLDQALNRLVQRTRLRVQDEAEAASSRVAATIVGDPQMVAVLSVGIRHGVTEAFSLEHLVQLVEASTKALHQKLDAPLMVQLQGDGTVLVACGAEVAQPIVVSLRQALAVAQALCDDPRLRFGLSCGTARLCTVAQCEQVLVGTPLEEAARLYRMSAAWHEYSLLCTEPVALLARAFPSQRTTLTLSHAALPSLPVYSVDLASALVAKRA